MAKARELHAEAEKLRELKQDFPRSLCYADRAIVAYEREDDLGGLSEALCSRFIALKHLYLKTQSSAYRVLAKNCALSAVEIAESLDDKRSLALPYLNMAEYFDTIENNYGEAVNYYEKAISAFENQPPENHNREGVLLNIKTHLLACKYRLGDENAMLELAEYAERIIKVEHEPYTRDVWSSGAFMKAAELLAGKDREKSEMFLQRAEEIINSNPDLRIRKGQLEELKAKLDNFVS